MTSRAAYLSGGPWKRGPAIPPQAAGGTIQLRSEGMGHRFLSALARQGSLISCPARASSGHFRRQAGERRFVRFAAVEVPWLHRLFPHLLRGYPLSQRFLCVTPAMHSLAQVSPFRQPRGPSAALSAGLLGLGPRPLLHALLSVTPTPPFMPPLLPRVPSSEATSSRRAIEWGWGGMS